jgi:hypothetical protein
MSEGFEKILHHNAPAGCPAVRANPAKFINYINNLGADHGRRITDSRLAHRMTLLKLVANQEVMCWGQAFILET